MGLAPLQEPRVVLSARGLGRDFAGFTAVNNVDRRSRSNTLPRYAGGFNALLSDADDRLMGMTSHGDACRSRLVSRTWRRGGQFAQLSGAQLVYAPPLPAGARIISAAIMDAQRNALGVLVHDGEIAGDTSATVRIVTFGFMADDGDGDPSRAEIDRVNLVDLDAEGAATFADNDTEHNTFAVYPAAHHAPAEVAYTVAGSDLRTTGLRWTASSAPGRFSDAGTIGPCGAGPSCRRAYCAPSCAHGGCASRSSA